MTAPWIDVRLAARTLVLHSRRNLLLGGALASVTALLVLLEGLGDGVHRSVVRSATSLATGHVNVSGFYKLKPSSAWPLLTDARMVAAEVWRHVPEAESVAVRVRGQARAVAAQGSLDLALSGVDMRDEPGLREVLRVREGSVDALATPGAVLLFEEQARRLAVRVGDDLTLAAMTPRGLHNTVDVRVVAIAADVGLLSARSAFVEAATLRRLLDLPATTAGTLLVYLADPTAARAAAARLRGALVKGGRRVLDPDPRPYWLKLKDDTAGAEWIGQKLDVTTWEDEISFLESVLRGLRAATGVLVTILMGIVAVGVMNAAWIAVRERTREIGTLRAIGMQRGRVLRLFLVEAALLGVAGTSAGALAGAVVAAVLDASHLPVPIGAQAFLLSPSLHLSVTLGAVLKAVGLLSSATALATIPPALRASRSKPVSAMNSLE